MPLRIWRIMILIKYLKKKPEYVREKPISVRPCSPPSMFHVSSPTATGKPKAMHGISFCVTANGALSMHPCGRSHWMILPTSLLIIKQTAWKLFFMKRTALNLLTIWAALVLSAIPEMRSVWKSRKAAMVIL